MTQEQLNMLIANDSKALVLKIRAVDMPVNGNQKATKLYEVTGVTRHETFEEVKIWVSKEPSYSVGDYIYFYRSFERGTVKYKYLC